MGHKTSGDRMARYFANSRINVDVCFDSEDRELLFRVINKILNLRLPIKFLQEHNLDFFRFRAQIGYALLVRRLIVRKLRQTDYNLLYIHTQPLAFLSLDIMQKIPTVISIDMTNVQAAAEKGDRRYQWTYQPNISFEKEVYQKATRIFTLTEWARQSVIKDYGINPAKVKHLPPGVDTNLVAFVDRSDRFQNPTTKAPFHLLFIGGDFKRKGGEDVLDVFLKNFADRAVLHIVTIKVIACEHPNVKVYTNIQAYTPEWFALYAQADAFVMPSYAEAFGLVFIEAMAAGLPVIASKLVQTSEIVRDGETGFLVTAGDRQELAIKMAALIDHPELGLAMGKRARAIAESDFDSTRNFQVMESIFEELSSAKS